MDLSSYSTSATCTSGQKLPWAILRIRDEVFHRFTEFLRNEGYLRTDTPILQPIHCEDSTQLFETDYFGDPMYLSQSGQLYLEALLHGLGKCMISAPFFRAEQSKTRKHLCEFWMLDWETPFADQSAARIWLEGMISMFWLPYWSIGRQELEILKRDVTALQRARDTRFVRLELRDAITILTSTMGCRSPLTMTSAPRQKKTLGDHFGIPVFVKN